MKIAEALILKNEYETIKNNLQTRINSNVITLEGQPPREDVTDLIDEYLQVESDLLELSININHKNLTTKLPNGQIVADALATKNALMNQKNMLDSAFRNATASYNYSEKSQELCLDIKNVQKQIKELSKEYRVLNSYIQMSNWAVDL